MNDANLPSAAVPTFGVRGVCVLLGILAVALLLVLSLGWWVFTTYGPMMFMTMVVGFLVVLWIWYRFIQE